MLQCYYLFLKFSLPVKIRVVGVKNVNAPRRHPIVFGFEILISLWSYLCVVQMSGPLLLCVLGLLFIIFKGEATFFVAKLSINSRSCGDGYQDA